ncbi:MAG: hypothetical protein JJU12_04140 [Chlamydiales bacterium]|nr:hypothetical protein [Chlamydiales bacterium]
MEEEVPATEDHKVPKFLYAAYLIVFVWGIWAFIAYWNGSSGWFDRGNWKQLQEAAHTTYPFEEKESYLEGGK